MKKFLLSLVLVILVVMSALMFACAPSDVADAKTKMQEEGYGVVDYSGNVSSNGFIGGIIATKDFNESTFGVDLKTVTALLFDSKDNAKAYLESLGETSAERLGCWVVWGDEEAVSDFD